MRIIRLIAIAFLVGAAGNAVSAQDYVDLGLSVKWCTVNTGVSAERPYGDYYRWQDAMAIRTTDGSRMGTKAEWEELRKYCTWKWVEQDGMGGYLVTSNIKGYKENSIFLPASGWMVNGRLDGYNGYAAYWCSTEGVQPDDEAAYGFNFKRGFSEWHSENRESEQQTRMVMPLSGKEITKITLDTKKLKIEQGTTARLSVTMSGGKRNVNSSCIWKSSDEKVIKVVDDGLLVAAGPGRCNVYVTAYGKTTGCAVTVTPRENEYVDLGLSVLWATCNLGATAPQEYGYYYAWGEIEPKEFFSWEKYRYRSFSEQNGMDKYTTDGYSHQGLKVDNLDRLEPADDAAMVLMGNGWRMPTREEFGELLENCTFDTVTVNGVAGMKFTSKVTGFEDRSIFIPYSGEMDGNEPVERGKNVFLWSSTAERGTNGGCFSTKSSVNGMMMMDELSPIEVLESAMHVNRGGDEYRYKGMNIRPVRALTDEMFKSLSLPAEQMDLDYGELRKLEAIMMPSGRPVNTTSVTWSSSDPGVAACYTDGTLTAVGQGRCVITAESGGRKAQMAVQVRLPMPEPVDLGLSVKWASANLGASSPRKAGGYFAWGETAPKAGEYSGATYKFGQYTNQFSKYNYVFEARNYSPEYPVDCKTTLDPEDDAARVVLGGGWRMPTADELWELKNRCSWQWIENADSSGYRITSCVPGYENNSIFLLAAGWAAEYDLFKQGFISGVGNYVNYRTSTLGVSLDGFSRFNGHPIRPVLDNGASDDGEHKIGPDPVNPSGRKVMVDLGLSVLWADCNVGADSPEQGGARFAWGETVEKTYYTEYNYKYIKFYEESQTSWYSKYIYKTRWGDFVGEPDEKTRLEPADDAAFVNWGADWRTPTKDEYDELIEKCEWTVDTVNGVPGLRVTSKVPGYTSNSIFLPYLPVETWDSDSWDHMKYMTSDADPEILQNCQILSIRIYNRRNWDEFEELNLEGAEPYNPECERKIESSRRFKCFFVRAVCDK